MMCEYHDGQTYSSSSLRSVKSLSRRFTLNDSYFIIPEDAVSRRDNMGGTVSRQLTLITKKSIRYKAHL